MSRRDEESRSYYWYRPAKQTPKPDINLQTCCWERRCMFRRYSLKICESFIHQIHIELSFMLKNSLIKYFGKCRCVFDARSASLINSSRERETFAFLFWTFEDVVIQTSMKNCVRWTGVKLSLFGLTIVQYWDSPPLFWIPGARPDIIATQSASTQSCGTLGLSSHRGHTSHITTSALSSKGRDVGHSPALSIWYPRGGRYETDWWRLHLCQPRAEGK